MRRFVLTHHLPPDALAAQLPQHLQRLALTLNAPQSGRITRPESAALWRALRALEKGRDTPRYYLALHPGVLNAGQSAQPHPGCRAIEYGFAHYQRTPRTAYRTL